MEFLYHLLHLPAAIYVLADVYEDILERKSILAAFLDNFVYSFLMLCSNLKRRSFLKDSCSLESETISVSF